MRVLLLTHGSRGDVQPFIALAHGLATHGWQPRLAAPARFATLAAEYDVPFHPLDDGTLDLQDAVAGGGLRAAAAAARQAKPLLRRMLDTTAEAMRTGPVDVIVHHPKALAGPHLAEALGVPALTATLMPLYVPTREFPLPLLPARVPVPGPLVRPSWRLVSMIDSPYRGMIRRWRREVLGLPARSPTTLTTKPDGRPAPVPLHAWSGNLLPAPADWPAAAAPLGFWFAPPRGPSRPSEELAAFLDAGEPPVYLGFGSIVGRDPAGLARTVLEAVRLAGVRAVLATGWGGLRPGDQPHREVLVIGQARHDWLFARVSAVVHHGGIGTVAAAALAGRPQVIRPFLGDQPFWASQVHRLGLGPVPLTGGLNPQRLADALTTATRTPDFGHQARELATRMRSEDGLSAAIRRLTDLVDAPRGALG